MIVSYFSPSTVYLMQVCKQGALLFAIHRPVKVCTLSHSSKSSLLQKSSVPATVYSISFVLVCHLKWSDSWKHIPKHVWYLPPIWIALSPNMCLLFWYFFSFSSLKACHGNEIELDFAITPNIIHTRSQRRKYIKCNRVRFDSNQSRCYAKRWVYLKLNFPLEAWYSNHILFSPNFCVGIHATYFHSACLSMRNDIDSIERFFF